MDWSSQRYIMTGRSLGRSDQLLDAAVAAIENVIVPTPALPALLTLNHLATRTGVRYQDLRRFVSGRIDAYKHFRIRKRSGGHRLISIPDPALMIVQRWLTAHILNYLPVHHCSYAFKPEASIKKCAGRHVGARWLIKMDVAGFFGSISEIQVYRVFRALNYGRLISFELARLTTYAPVTSPRYLHRTWRGKRHPSPIHTYGRERLGYLPQGAPTSPMLSNLIMRDADREIETIARKAGLRYTRYSDDLTFSTSGEFSRESAKKIIKDVSAILRRMGLQPNPRKTTIVPPGGRKVVLGLLVDGPEPRLPKEFKSRLRQHLYYLERLGPWEHTKNRSFDSIWGMHRHIRGLIDYAKMIEEDYASLMKKRLDAVSWPKIDEPAINKPLITQ
jgi:RNA-directed DNA polymerase